MLWGEWDEEGVRGRGSDGECEAGMMGGGGIGGYSENSFNSVQVNATVWLPPPPSSPPVVVIVAAAAAAAECNVWIGRDDVGLTPRGEVLGWGWQPPPLNGEMRACCGRLVPSGGRGGGEKIVWLFGCRRTGASLTSESWRRAWLLWWWWWR